MEYELLRGIDEDFPEPTTEELAAIDDEDWGDPDASDIPSDLADDIRGACRAMEEVCTAIGAGDTDALDDDMVYVLTTCREALESHL